MTVYDEPSRLLLRRLVGWVGGLGFNTAPSLILLEPHTIQVRFFLAALGSATYSSIFFRHPICFKGWFAVCVEILYRIHLFILFFSPPVASSLRGKAYTLDPFTGEE